MSFITTLNARISTLGPLHLGTGEDYYPTGYVIKEGYLHAFDDHALLAGLGKNGVSQLAQLAEKGNEGNLLAIQRQIYSCADQLMALASHSVWVAPGIAQFYNSRIGQIAQKEADGSKVQNKLQVQRTFSNPYSHQPIIPGSALKGAIRTAWLDHLNGGNPLLNKQEKNQDLQKRLLGNKSVTDDPFSLLKVSDASYVHPDSIAPTEIWFSISRKRKQRPDRSPQGVQNLLECIGPWRAKSFAFDIRFITGKLRETTTRVPSTPQELISVCNAYYLPKLKHELETLGERERYFSETWLIPLQRLLSGELGQALSAGKAMLLRLGKYSGAEDKTLNGVRQIRILTKKDPVTGKQGSETRNQTTEVRLAAQHSGDLKNLLPFGWVLVEFEDTVLPQTHAFLRQQAEPAYQRRQQEAAWIKRREDELQQQAQKAEELRQRELEKAAQAEAEKQRLAAFAALPPELQELEKFKEILSKDTASAGKGLGSPLANELRNLVNNAQSWAPEWKAKALECVELAFKHLVVDRKKNDKAKALWKQLA